MVQFTKLNTKTTAAVLLGVWTAMTLVASQGFVAAQSDTPTAASASASPSSSGNALGSLLEDPVGGLKDIFVPKPQPPKKSSSKKSSKKEDEDEDSSKSDSDDDDSNTKTVIKEKTVPKNQGSGITGNAAAGAASNNGDSRTGTGVGFDKVLGDNNSAQLLGGPLLPSNSSLLRRRQSNLHSRRSSKVLN